MTEPLTDEEIAHIEERCEQHETARRDIATLLAEIRRLRAEVDDRRRGNIVLSASLETDVPRALQTGRREGIESAAACCEKAAQSARERYRRTLEPANATEVDACEARKAAQAAIDGYPAGAVVDMLRSTAHLHASALWALVWLLGGEEE